MDQFGQKIDFRRAARRDAEAAGEFLHQAQDTVRCHQPLANFADKTHGYAKLIDDRLRPEDALSHVGSKYLNNRIERDHAALKPLLCPARGFQPQACAKAEFAGINTLHTIREGQFEDCEAGAINENSLITKQFPEPA